MLRQLSHFNPLFNPPYCPGKLNQRKAVKWKNRRYCSYSTSGLKPAYPRSVTTFRQDFFQCCHHTTESLAFDSTITTLKFSHFMLQGFYFHIPMQQKKTKTNKQTNTHHQTTPHTKPHLIAVLLHQLNLHLRAAKLYALCQTGL